jgi:hypothetical protein
MFCKIIILQIYEYLNNFYKFENAPTDSFFKTIRKKRETMKLDENVKSKKNIEEKLNQFFRFKHDEHGLVDTLKTVLRKFNKYDENSHHIILLSSLLAIILIQHQVTNGPIL